MDYNTYEEKFLKEYHKIKPLTSFRRAQLKYTYDKTSICPRCGTKTIVDLDKAEIYCPDCGLVVKASIEYVGNRQVSYPYGLLL